MNLLNQNAKVRRHMAMLTIVLLILLPFAGIAALLLAAVIFSGSPPGPWNQMAAGTVLGIPAIFLVTGILILARLRDGFNSSTRRRLFGFYVCLLAYCGFWLAGSVSHDGAKFSFFDLPDVLAITLLIAIPAVATMLTPPNSE